MQTGRGTGALRNALHPVRQKVRFFPALVLVQGKSGPRGGPVNAVDQRQSTGLTRVVYRVDQKWSTALTHKRKKQTKERNVQRDTRLRFVMPFKTQLQN